MNNWQEQRYNFLMAMREFLIEVHGDKNFPDSICKMLDRIADIATEDEFKRFNSYVLKACEEAFEKASRFEAV